MSTYDVDFIGQICFDETIHYDGQQSLTCGGAALYGAIAGARLGKKISAHLMLAPGDQGELEVFKKNGVDVFPIDSPETTRVLITHKSTNMEDRQIITSQYAGKFQADQIGDIDAKHVHLAGCNDHEFPLEFMQAIKNRGIPMSIDMQCLLRTNDPETGEIKYGDDPQKKDVVSLMDKIKLDITEIKTFTGKQTAEEGALVIEEWGCPEILITQSDGVMVRANGQNTFATFDNKSTLGRTGRGDTTFGAYLAWRTDHSPEEALKVAAYVVSRKIEKPGPWLGSVEDLPRV